jgi:universal stress protein A
MPYQHVLAAVDLSEESEQVLQRAREAADLHGAKLSLVSIVKPLTQVYGGIDVAPLPGTPVSFEEQALQQTASGLQALGARFGVAAEDTHALLGSPAYDIRDLAQRIGADLIVIGTHGRHGLGLLLGSTATSVLHGVQRDVLVVRVRVPA